MKNLKVFNPTEENLRTVYLGEEYKIKSKATETFEATLAKRFIETYPFLELVEEKEVTEKSSVLKEVIKTKTK